MRAHNHSRLLRRPTIAADLAPSGPDWSRTFIHKVTADRNHK
jgi:hypothetical protein